MPQISKEKAIIADKLTRRFGDFTATDEITFEVYKGEIFGFLGANGAGKTTAIKMLCGLLEPSSGRATVGGFDIQQHTQQLKQNIGYMGQKFSLYDDLTILENIRYYAGIYGLSNQQIKNKSEELIARLGLQKEAKKLVGYLPTGWKQKVAFSVALLHEPKIVFLDEPTGGVDPITRRQFWDMIYESAARGITIFITTHYMDEAEYCDRISIMVDGKIEALDTPFALRRQFKAETIDEVFYQLARGARRSE
jgi:ABC-2 type transport system ATP-binding protein